MPMPPDPSFPFRSNGPTDLETMRGSLHKPGRPAVRLLRGDHRSDCDRRDIPHFYSLSTGNSDGEVRYSPDSSAQLRRSLRSANAGDSAGSDDNVATTPAAFAPACRLRCGSHARSYFDGSGCVCLTELDVDRTLEDGAIASSSFCIYSDLICLSGR